MRRVEPSDRYGGRDPVTPDVAKLVVERQRGVCLAVLLGETVVGCAGRLTFDHVKDQPLVGDPVVKRGPTRRRRYRAPSDADHLVAICVRHHLYGWATAHRPQIREWLRRSRG